MRTTTPAGTFAPDYWDGQGRSGIFTRAPSAEEAIRWFLTRAPRSISDFLPADLRSDLLGQEIDGLKDGRERRIRHLQGHMTAPEAPEPT